MNERRLHPFTVLRFLRKTLVVYLLPLVQVLFERNWTALHTALRRDALLFLLLCAVSWGILRVSSWSLDNTGVFHLHWRLGIRLDRALRGEMLAALTIDRPLLYRMAGASRLTLYPVGAAQKHTLSVCLSKADAEAVADQLMPLVKPTLHRPAGGERAALGFLGANGLSTLALFVLAVRQTRDVPDWNPAVFAQIQVSFLARFAARWLPAGAAWLLAAAGFLLGASLMRSFAQTVHYTVWHTADQIGSRGGWLGHFECRVRTSEISFADVRISPAARLMKRWPVFVTAGGCSPRAAAVRLPQRRGGIVPGAAAGVPDAARPAGPHRAAQSHLFCTGRHSLCPLPAADAGLGHSAAPADRDPAHPHVLLWGTAGRSRGRLPAGGPLAAGGPHDPAAAAGALPALHLCISPGCLPDRSTKPLGCQCGPHQSDPDLSRLGKAQGEERAAAGCGEIFQIYGNELNLSAADRRQLSQ